MFSDFSQKLYIRVVKSNFYLFSNYFEETDFWYILGLWAYFFLTFGDKIFRKVFKTASYTFRRTLWWKTILLKNLLQSFGLWSKQFFLTDDNFFVANLSRLLSTTSGEHFDKKTFLKNPSSFFSGQWAIYFPTFGKISTDRLSKLFCTCSENSLKMRVFLNCFVFGANSDFEQIFSWHSAQIFP